MMTGLGIRKGYWLGASLAVSKVTKGNRAMKKSETINELASALAKAAGDRHLECRVIPVASRVIFGKKFGNKTFTNPAELLFNRVAYGLADCWYWIGGIDALGYGRLGKSAAGVGENKAHRFSYRIFHGDIPDGLKVCHRCDVRSCVNPDHLFLGTQAENVRDMIDKGRGRTVAQKGSSNGGSKLSEAEVLRMRQVRAETGKPYHEIAAMFGVTTMTAHRAITGKLWGHV